MTRAIHMLVLSCTAIAGTFACTSSNGSSQNTAGGRDAANSSADRYFAADLQSDGVTGGVSGAGGNAGSTGGNVGSTGGTRGAAGVTQDAALPTSPDAAPRDSRDASLAPDTRPPVDSQPDSAVNSCSALAAKNNIAGQNNQATLQGTTLGAGVTPVSSLRRTVPATLTSNASCFSFGPAYLLRDTGSDTTAAYLAIPITNTTSGAFCNLSPTLNLKDGAGVLLQTAQPAGTAAFVGSVRLLPDGTGGSFSVTCVAAGETGYLIGTAYLDYNTVSSVSVDLGPISSYLQAVDPGTRVVPQGYSSDSSGNLTITVSNLGPKAVTMMWSATWFLLDSAGSPLFWGIAENPSSVLTLAAGATGSLVDSGMSGNWYEGSGNRLLVFVDFRS